MIDVAEPLFDLAAVQEGFTERCSWIELRLLRHSRRHSGYADGLGFHRPHKKEFSFLNANLMAPTRELFICGDETFQ